ncbi:helix-turn-helix transcriptional regulator [Microbacterium sp. X-17]|uniref:helix-turn-helix transcriptional regulator n=1 Tax=Microbacterium sp. X-17 TaxID=3144404 RepID=UPI0031F54BAA
MIHSTAISPDADVVECADAWLEALRGFVEPDAITLVGLDPLRTDDRHVVLASTGYSEEVLRHATSAFLENPVHRLTLTAGMPLRWRDLRRDWDIDFAHSATGEDLLTPAGYHEGASASLRLARGRYVGGLHVSWNQASAATDQRRDAIARLMPILANDLDLMREPNSLARRLPPTFSARLISRSGDPASLDFREQGPHLSDTGHLWRLLTANGGRPPVGRSLWIDADRKVHRVHVIACRSDARLVTEVEVDAPFRLSIRELEVLHWVAGGASNPEIARRIFVSTRTVATHVEHLLQKLGCRTRAELAATAVREELLLAGLPDSGA